jgi:hypothetical protein
MTPGRFFGIVFAIHLVVSVGYYFLADGFGAGSRSIGAGNVGLALFGGMLLVFRLAGGETGSASEFLPLIFLINSAVTAGVATGILQLVRRVRAA